MRQRQTCWAGICRRTYDRYSGAHPLAEIAGRVDDVWPYWMDKSAAVSNSFDIDGMFLLTAPNMSGKSTLMRSTAAAALLANCGLCAPVGRNTFIRRFDSLFVRGASADVPTENKSAFGAEMGDIAALLRSCGQDSLVFVDELGRGTSPKDGTSIAAAVLEAMADSGMSGIFATHLHDIMDLSLTSWDRIRKKRMAVDQTADDYSWTYRIEDGVCTDSLALVTAARFGLPQSLLERAAALNDELVASDASTSSAFEMQKGVNGDVVNGKYKRKEATASGLDLACGILGVDDSSAYRIPPQWSPPPSLEGSSCVYIVELNEEPPRYYVGETDSMQRRLQQHRAKGGPWTSLTALALPVSGGKSQARNMESLVIQRLAKAGFELVSISDGRTIRPARKP